MPPIRFYSVNAEYGELSNFALYPIQLHGGDGSGRNELGRILMAVRQAVASPGRR